MSKFYGTDDSIYRDSVFLFFDGVPYFNRIEIYDEEGDQLYQNYDEDEDNFYYFDSEDQVFIICDFGAITKLKKKDGL